MTNFTETHKHSIVICSLDSLIWIHGPLDLHLFVSPTPSTIVFLLDTDSRSSEQLSLRFFFNYSKQNKIKNLLFLLLQHSLVHI